MKLCSQCQFIYEDDQECCDMDGAQLVYEPTLQTGSLNTEAIGAIGSTGSIATPARRSLGLPIAAAVLLAVVVFASFYASSRAFEAAPGTSAETSATKLENQNPQPVGPRDMQSVPSSGVAAATEGATQNGQNANGSATTPVEQSPGPERSPKFNQPTSSPANQPSLNSAPASPSIDPGGEDQLAAAVSSHSARPSRNLRSAHATIRSRSAADKRLTIPRLPELTNLPRVAPLRRLPPAK